MRLRDRVKELRRVKASEIVGAPWNWRVHDKSQKEAIAGSIDELGFFDPLDTRELPDGRLELIDGHARHDLINDRIGPDTIIPCIVTDFTEAEAKLANAIKDPIAALGMADDQKLNALLAEAKSQDEAVNGLLERLAKEHAIDDSPTEIKQIETRPPPKMSWVLFGIPTARFGEIAQVIENLALVPGAICETSLNDVEVNDGLGDDQELGAEVGQSRAETEAGSAPVHAGQVSRRRKR